MISRSETPQPPADAVFPEDQDENEPVTVSTFHLGLVDGC